MSAPLTGSNRPSLPAFDLAGLSAFWRKLYPRNTADHVASDTGFPVDTVKNWLKGRNAMRVPQVLVVLAVYGPGALTAMWGGRVPLWLEASVAASRLEELDQMQAALAAERAALMALPGEPQRKRGR